MLYKLYETQRSLMEPLTDLAQSAAKLYGNPLSFMGQHPLSQRISAGYDLMHRLGKDYEKPEFGLRTVDVDGVEVAVHERIEVKKPFCELRRFKRYHELTLRTLLGLREKWTKDAAFTYPRLLEELDLTVDYTRRKSFKRYWLPARWRP